MDASSYLSGSDLNAIETLYRQYQQDPSSVDSSWQRFFEGFEFQRAEFAPMPSGDGLSGALSSEVIKEFKVINLINGYRQRGHLFTETNPVRERRKHQPTRRKFETRRPTKCRRQPTASSQPARKPDRWNARRCIARESAANNRAGSLAW